jgi:hypothetical protein
MESVELGFKAHLKKVQMDRESISKAKVKGAEGSVLHSSETCVMVLLRVLLYRLTMSLRASSLQSDSKVG